ncbi:MAG TPA: farnesyl diphosphate synthase [Vicinamibacterales bacterium]|nr:farnesyl diphosphate synthase [Vicinamibacterales bacterium]
MTIARGSEEGRRAAAVDRAGQGDALMDVDGYLRARKADVDRALTELLPLADCPRPLADAMRYSVMSGGKRLRPLLCLAAADAVGVRGQLALPAACAIELIHTYSLVHDDLPAMDDDTLRRGQPTLHVVAGEGMAILAGDGLLTEAFHLLAREPRTTDLELLSRKMRVIERIALAAGPVGMVGGQAIDLSSVTLSPSGRSEPPLDGDGVRDMHARKTGALIRAAATAGAIMGGGTDAQVTAVDSAAAEFGLAFQIVDDILDVEGGSADLGKTAGKDAAAGKPTFPMLYGLERSRSMAAECLERAESTLSAADLADARLLRIGRWIVDRTN